MTESTSDKRQLAFDLLMSELAAAQASARLRAAERDAARTEAAEMLGEIDLLAEYLDERFRDDWLTYINGDDDDTVVHCALRVLERFRLGGAP